MTDKAAARARFEKVYAKVADELLAELRKENIPEEVVEWYHKVSTCCSFVGTLANRIRTSTTMSPEASSTVACPSSILSRFSSGVP